MTNLQLWTEVNDIYHQSSIGVLRRSYWKNLKNKWFFMLLYLFFVLVIPLLILLTFDKYILIGNVIQIISALAFLWHIRVRSIAHEFVKYRDIGFSLSERINHLRYERFYKMCKLKLSQSTERLNQVLNWNKIHQSNFSVFHKFFNSKIVVVVLGSILSFFIYLVESNGYLSKLESSLFLLFGFFVTVCILLFYLFYDVFHNKERRNFEVCKLLKMYIADLKVETKH